MTASSTPSAGPDSAAIVELLRKQRNLQGWWTGELSTSALSTATACMALHLAAQATQDDSERRRFRSLADSGIQWLINHQNSDGGWGDTILSISNISTSMLAFAVLTATDSQHTESLQKAKAYVDRQGGVTAVLNRYGNDRTFSVPILTHCALAGIVDWKDVIPLPFELACVPAGWYAAVRMPVVSYALPALIAIGQVIFHHQSHWNPLIRLLRRKSIRKSLSVLESIQPPNGGFLEATPLTSFVCMSLLGCGHLHHPVTQKCLQFIVQSVRPDGSWPIDTNLTTWVTTLSVNALCGAAPGSELTEDERLPIRNWLLNQQYKTIHPYTNAAPGGWSWTDLPGGVPDADDTPGAMLALLNLRHPSENIPEIERVALRNAALWLLDLQNRDGGWPTFCRGWGTLPFDRSSNDLTAHALRALETLNRRVDSLSTTVRDRISRSVNKGRDFLRKTQRSDGTWLPLWFGHQFNQDEENPLYGTAKVLMFLQDDLNHPATSRMADQAIHWMVANQNPDGGWSARKGLVSSVEETGLAVECLSAVNFVKKPGVLNATRLGAEWLKERVNEGTVVQPSPIGFYFAKLWYFEALYPMIFAASGLIRWVQTNCNMPESSSQE